MESLSSETNRNASLRAGYCCRLYEHLTNYTTSASSVCGRWRQRELIWTKALIGTRC